jgi:hypothetical protein
VTAPVSATSAGEGWRYNSGARLDTTTLSLPVPRAWIAEVLARWGLVACPLEGTPADLHPLYVDLWRVVDGRAELGGLDQHEWAERSGAATAGLTGAGLGAFWGGAAGSARGALEGGWAGARLGPWGAWCGAAFGSMLGGAFGATSGARAATEWLGGRSGQAARLASERLSQTIGRYHEVVVGVPNAGRATRTGSLGMFVLAMYSDNPVAIWGDRLLGTGYRKRLASIRQEETSFSVQVDDAIVLQGSIEPLAGAEDADGVTGEALPPLGALSAQALLGRLADGRLVASVLDRSYRAPARLLGARGADVVLGPGLFEGARAGRYRVGAAAPGSPFGLVRATGVGARLTFPRAV